MWCAFVNERLLGSKAEERDAKRMCREHARQLVYSEIAKRFPVQTLVEAEASAAVPDAKRFAIVRESAAYNVYRIQPDPGWIYNGARLEPYMRFSWKEVHPDLAKDGTPAARAVAPWPPKPLPKFDWATLHKADNVLVLGSRGCGKTTLLRKILAEKIEPDQELHICSTNLDEVEDFQSFGAHFYSTYALNGLADAKSLTLMDNVRFPRTGQHTLACDQNHSVILGATSLLDFIPELRAQMGLIFAYDLGIAEIGRLYRLVSGMPIPQHHFIAQVQSLPERTFIVVDRVSNKDCVTLWAANASD